jgi:pimeloyl-ACP methyl ester carboxylesterase
MPGRQRQTIDVPLPDGGRLHGVLCWTGQAGPAAMLYVHGFGSDHAGDKALALEAACARRGWTMAAFDFRGHGGSSGSLLELRASGLLADLEAIRGFLASRDVSRLFLVGSSMGGFASAWFAVEHPGVVPACVLIAPAFSFVQARWAALDEAGRAAWQRTGRLRVRNQWLDVELGYGLVEEADRFDPARLAASWATPALIFHGLDDDTVPVEGSREFLRRVRWPDMELCVLEGGDHRLHAWKEEMAEQGCRFCARFWPVG